MGTAGGDRIEKISLTHTIRAKMGKQQGRVKKKEVRRGEAKTRNMEKKMQKWANSRNE